MKTILLTGATGYLGGFLSKKLLNKNHKLVALCLDDSESFKYENNSLVDVCYLNKMTIREIFQKHKIDVVIHTATLYGRNKESISKMISANVSFPVSVLSTACEYGASLFINTDTILAKDINPYSLTKAHFSEWLNFYNHKIKCVNLSLDHFYGPNDKTIKFVAWIINELRCNVEKIDLTEGGQKRDFTYIDDVVNAYACVLENQEKLSLGETNSFDVGTNVKTTIKELVETLKKLTNNKTTKLNFGAIPYRDKEVLNYDIDTSGLKLLGWTPSLTLEEGLKKTIKGEK